MLSSCTLTACWQWYARNHCLRQNLAPASLGKMSSIVGTTYFTALCSLFKSTHILGWSFSSCFPVDVLHTCSASFPVNSTAYTPVSVPLLHQVLSLCNTSETFAHFGQCSMQESSKFSAGGKLAIIRHLLTLCSIM